MKVISAEFVTSAMRPDQYPKDGRPEFAFAGRSNVGKSTLLNTLLKKKGLAKTSSAPGKTQTINFFDVNGRIYFVDLPGYGYAKAPKSLRARWGPAIAAYVNGRDSLKLAVQLVDARHEPTDKDLDMVALLERARVPTLIVATKIDKLKRSERSRNLARIRETFDLDEDAVLLPVSGVTGEGIPELWSFINDMLA
jgi:GTP-binding protein